MRENLIMRLFVKYWSKNLICRLTDFLKKRQIKRGRTYNDQSWKIN